ncbi:MAG: histidine phosphatase family protein [Pseudomonadota bacterium]
MVAQARRLYLLRHGPTDWNAEHRIQGHTDIELSDLGRATVSRRALSARPRAARWFTSPLKRARETAALMHLHAEVESSLIEIAFGDWEGISKHDLRIDKALVGRGWDRRPPGGESRREALHRVLAWLAAVPGDSDVGAVVHGGLIKAMYAHATGWDLRGDPPHTLHWEAVHGFDMDRYGRIVGDSYSSELIGDSAAWDFPFAA